MGRMLCQFVNYASVEYPPLYVPNGTEREDPDIYAENVRRSMADIMKVCLVASDRSLLDWGVLVVH